MSVLLFQRGCCLPSANKRSRCPCCCFSVAVVSHQPTRGPDVRVVVSAWLLSPFSQQEVQMSVLLFQRGCCLPSANNRSRCLCCCFRFLCCCFRCLCCCFSVAVVSHQPTTGPDVCVVVSDFCVVVSDVCVVVSAWLLSPISQQEVQMSVLLFQRGCCLPSANRRSRCPCCCFSVAVVSHQPTRGPDVCVVVSAWLLSPISQQEVQMSVLLFQRGCCLPSANKRSRCLYCCFSVAVVSHQPTRGPDVCVVVSAWLLSPISQQEVQMSVLLFQRGCCLPSANKRSSLDAVTQLTTSSRRRSNSHSSAGMMTPAPSRRCPPQTPCRASSHPTRTPSHPPVTSPRDTGLWTAADLL